ncbi:MAG: DNA primase, partial [Myxococcales bacterium]|nr:DNA primase [Myxococcales bacterium]
MAAIPDEIIQRVRDAHDIVEVVSRSLELKRAGSAWKACCPFHEEKTPSFQVNPRLQIFKCFGCGKGGNVFHWLMETRGLTFPEAVRQLAEERSIEVPTVRGVDPGVSRDQRLRLRDALEAALSWFRRVLEAPVGAEARSYLERRGYDVERQRE